MKIKQWQVCVSLALVHLSIMLCSFPKVFLHPYNALLCNWGDGIKNYFTQLSYVKEPIGADGIFKYNTFFYPFGDYVYYTDNSPLFSIPFRWFCHSVCDISNYTIPVFNAFILSQILITGLLVYYIFSHFLGKNLFSFAMAVFLPWTNTQITRIWAGHFNLSCASVVLLAIALILLWHKNKENYIKRVWVFLAMVLLVFCAFLLHGYYLAIIMIFLSVMLLILGLLHFKEGFGKQSIAASVMLPVMVGAMVFSLLKATDKYLLLRGDKAMLYDLATFKTNYTMLFTHYPFQSLGFPVASTMQQNPESMVYLGNIGLMAFSLLLLGMALSSSFRLKVINIQKGFFANKLYKGVFLGGVVMLCVSFGEWYTSNREPLAIFTPFPAVNKLPAATVLLYGCLLAISIYLVVLAISKNARQALREIALGYKQTPVKKLKVLFATALVIYLFVAHYSITVPILLNPLFYVHFITNRVEQFRCLSRFGWPFFWVFYIWVMYTMVQLYKTYNLVGKRAIVALLVIVGTWEVSDYMFQLRGFANYPNCFSAEQLHRFDPLKVDFKQYQAVLPIPFYMVGSEDYPHTIDDINDWTIYTMQLALHSRLPLIASKMSRTPPQYTIDLLDFVANDKIALSISSRINSLPILLVCNKTLATDPNQIYECAKDRPLTRELYTKANQFVARHHLSPIDSADGVYYYAYKMQ